ncbi:MAG TPA: hypothetical protein PKI60_02025 [Oscillospiraceae bacterium]|nr:hypothetical protein [Oscillospiraceae bacterium]
MKKIVSILCCLVIGFVISIPVSATINPNYVGVYESGDVRSFIEVETSDIICVKALSDDGEYISAGNATTKNLQYNEFLVTYYGYTGFTSLSGTGIHHYDSTSLQGSYTPDCINANGINYVR